MGRLLSCVCRNLRQLTLEASALNPPFLEKHFLPGIFRTYRRQSGNYPETGL